MIPAAIDLEDHPPAVADPARRRWGGWRRPELLAALLILVAAFAIRAWEFGNPLIQVDETFYLLVGDRMLHGALPYVDIWDRKPIGLFLIYAAIRLLGGQGIVQYQVVATLFAGATGIVIMAIARRMAPLAAATVAALLYLLMLGLAGGLGGQSPVFYNLFVALAALLTLRLELDAAPAPARVRRLGMAAMLLAGVAMQIKYSALFEGVFLGVVLLRHSWRATPAPGRLVADAALWVAVALAPTLLALAFYAARHQAGAFIYANFLSIGDRGHEGGAILAKRLEHSWMALHLPFFCVLLSALLEPWRRFAEGPRTFRFALAWLGAALFGYFLFGTFFDHYALPLMVPIAIAMAPLFGVRRRRIGLVAAAFMLLAGGAAYAWTVHTNKLDRGGRAAADAMVAAIMPHLTGCLYVYDGNSILYLLTHACIPTRYAFPQHLTLTREADALGVDPVREVRRIFATRPSVVVDRVDRSEPDENPAVNAVARGLLRQDYTAVARVPHHGGWTIIYKRRR